MVERTQKEAKAVSLKVWKYIAKHQLLSKDDLPPKLYKLIEEDICNCPICSMFMFNGSCHGRVSRGEGFPRGNDWSNSPLATAG